MTATRHVWPLDRALACGIPELEFNGKKWTFSPLVYNDWGDVIALARSEALKAYFDAVNGRNIGYSQRAQDLSTILYGAVAQHSVTALRSPAVRKLVLKKSLVKKHPDVTDEELDAFLEDEHKANLVVDFVDILSGGPLDPTAVGQESDGEENPTTPGSDPVQTTLNLSVPSSSESTDTPSKALED
jgi:hypothetical protein